MAQCSCGCFPSVVHLKAEVAELKLRLERLERELLALAREREKERVWRT